MWKVVVMHEHIYYTRFSMFFPWLICLYNKSANWYIGPYRSYVGSAWSFVFFHPRHNDQWPPTSKDFLSQILSIALFSYLNSWFLRKSQYFPFLCLVVNKGTTGTIYITSLVWRGPLLGIEPWTSCTRSQHYTTRLSRRWCS